jgi:hypothetical protein
MNALNLRSTALWRPKATLRCRSRTLLTINSKRLWRTRYVAVSPLDTLAGCEAVIDFTDVPLSGS